MALVGHWTLTQDNYSGGKFQDLSGNENHGTPANVPVFTTNQQGRVDKATVFDGISDLVNLGNVAGFNMGISDWSYSLWVYTNDGAHRFLGGKYHPGFQLGLNGNKLYAFVYSGSTLLNFTSSNITISNGAWYHVLYTFDRSGNMTTYVNNVFDDSANISAWEATNIQSAVDFVIGARNVGNDEWNGNLCNVQLYNEVVSEAVRTNIYGSELFWHTELITGQMDFAGRLSAQNPKWLLLDRSLNWIGEWDELYSYNVNDAVLYKISDGNEWHIFVSKTSHNVGNVPTTSAAYWRRYYQEQLL